LPTHQFDCTHIDVPSAESNFDGDGRGVAAVLRAGTVGATGRSAGSRRAERPRCDGGRLPTLAEALIGAFDTSIEAANGEQILQHRGGHDVSVTPMIQRRRGRWAALLAALALAACNSASRTSPTTAQPAATAPSTTAPMTIQPGALFYTKAGSLYVSEPPGAPGRKLTDGPADFDPAPSPDLSHVAFVRKNSGADYGGELWMLDLSSQLAPVGPPRRLVDPATLPRVGGGVPPMVASPRWSPTAGQVAFVANPTGGMVDGGYLLVAAADTGGLVPTQQNVFAEPAFAWAPDGRHIAWIPQRSDVRPVDVRVLAVGGESTPVATGTNASSVTYGDGGSRVIFTNPDTTDPVMYPKNPFAVRAGGVYAVAASAETGAVLPAPTLLFTRQGWSYSNIATLDSGAVAFTAQEVRRGAPSSEMIQVLDKGSSLPRTTVTDLANKLICQHSPQGGQVCYASQGPAWGAGDLVAYLDSSPEMRLVVTDVDNRNPKPVDTGVDSFAFPPSPR
jgi:TolB protein